MSVTGDSESPRMTRDERRDDHEHESREARYMPGTASLIPDIDSEFFFVVTKLHLVIFCLLVERMMVVLRDGRTLVGWLRSIDQFGKYKI